FIISSPLGGRPQVASSLGVAIGFPVSSHLDRIYLTRLCLISTLLTGSTPMIDIEEEDILTFDQAREECTRLRGGRRLAKSTIWRWCKVGVKGIRLEVVYCGGQRLTSKQALARFFQLLANLRQSGDSTPVQAPQRGRTPAEIRRAGEGAARRL